MIFWLKAFSPIIWHTFSAICGRSICVLCYSSKKKSIIGSRDAWAEEMESRYCALESTSCCLYLRMCIIISVIILPFSFLNVLVLVCCENVLNFLMCLFSVFNWMTHWEKVYIKNKCAHVCCRVVAEPFWGAGASARRLPRVWTPPHHYEAVQSFKTPISGLRCF